MSERPHLSVVIPAYNEAQRIAPTLARVQEYLGAQPYRWELIVVDDGSADDTVAVVRQSLRPDTPARVIENPRNRGKGAVVRQGMLAATGERVLFSDADLATPIEEIERFLPEFDAGFDVVIGTRKVAQAQIARRQPWIRRVMGRGFTWLTHALVVRGISDITCGFKCFTYEAAQAIFSRQRLDDWSFDAEILFIAQRLHYRLREVPVRWSDVRQTKVRLLRDTGRSLLGLLRIRLHAARGCYAAPEE